MICDVTLDPRANPRRKRHESLEGPAYQLSCRLAIETTSRGVIAATSAIPA
jgi:hypothetical protein